ncbi:PilW family protein [Pseudoxanthomonas winnipegensis]|uniref:PilW family protein n=1 Tax=Pseudoxanthomonas winnipegensis TaxID=2480810 RepID=UPI0030F410A6
MKSTHAPGGSGQRGLSLIELMIAVTIGLILIAGVIQIFSASRAAYQLSQGIARSQENARFSMDFLQRDIRMAGHAGCVNDQSLLSTDSTGKITGGNIRLLFANAAQREAGDLSSLPTPLRFDVSIQGYEANGTAPGDTRTIATTPAVGSAGDWSPALPAELITNLDPKPIAGSDIIVLRYMSPIQATLSSMVVSTTGASTIGYPTEAATTSSKVATGTGNTGLYAIGNCGATSVFQGSAISNTGMSVAISGLNKSALGYTVSSANANVAETYSYAPNQTWLYRAETMAYYVALNPSNPQVPALYRVRWTQSASGVPGQISEEMVEGVESMQLLYGEDSASATATTATGFINKTATAATIGDPLPNSSAGAASALRWRRVGSVQLGLLIRGTGDRATAEQNPGLRVLDVGITAPTDGNYRYTYETSIALRNRLFGN